MKQLTDEQIREMRKVRDDLISSYGARDEMLRRYEEIYFMTRKANPKGLRGVDDKDIKETISSSGRDAVIGMKRILDSGDVHIKVIGEGGDPDKIEAGLKKMMKVSGEYRIASVEKDLNLSASLYGPGVLNVESVADLIEAQADGGKEFVKKQLELLSRKTPFMLNTITPTQSYPMWGAYGMIGHARKYKLKGMEITDRWSVECKDPNQEYEVKDFFYYEKRLVEADGISDPLMAVEWVSRDSKGEIIGSINIPVFARYAGGSSLFHEPEKQSQPLLYGKAKGEWDLRETLFYTYLFTAIYQQGLPGPLMMIDPENASQDIEVEYKRGIRTIVAKGQFANNQIIDGDVMQLRNIMQDQAATQTVQPQTLGQNTNGVTFSQFAMASKAGLIPAIDPKESQEALYKDAFTHILQRIKEENIENDLIQPGDIPDEFELEVTIEPDLEQDDLRNSQIAMQLLSSGANVSKEWVNTNLLKIADSKAMLRQKKKEELFDAMVELMKTPEVLGKYVQAVLGKKSVGGGQLPVDGGEMPAGGGLDTDASTRPSEIPGMPGMDQLPKTDAMIPPEERM